MNLQLNTLYILKYKDIIKNQIPFNLFPVINNVDNLNIFSLFDFLLKEKNANNYWYLYSYEITQLFNLLKSLQDSSFYTFKQFTYQNIMYSLEISCFLYPKKKILIKDLYNFFSENIIYNDVVKDYKLLAILYNEIQTAYNININRKYILSTASLSLRIFKKSFPEKYRLIPHLTRDEDNYIRKSYIGGRNEIFEHVAQRNYFYDVNSLYPYIMKKEKMPIGIPEYRDKEYMKKFEKNIENFFGFIDVLITIEKTNNNIPVLPYRMGIKNNVEVGIIYAKGTLRGIYFSEEIKLALKQGYKIIEIYSAYEYKEKEVVFEEYVEQMYNRRLKAKDPALKDLYKKLLNTLYGRFGLVYEQIDIISPEKELITDNTYISHDTTEFIDITANTCYNNIAITSAITSYARIFMYNTILNYNLHVIYIDTDGLFLKNPIPDIALTTSKEMGKFRLESINAEAHFIANKFYIYAPINSPIIYKFKGIPLQKPIFNIHDIITQHKKILNITLGHHYFTFSIRLNNNQTYSFQASRKRKLIPNYKTTPWIICIR
nr:unassigned reading frame (possible DNA polymerase) [Physarum polycephalum]